MELQGLPQPAPNTRLLVGFSGGPDSVALLHLLHQAGYQVVATHCNFHLRGPESMRDEQFCRCFCAERNIPLVVQSFDTRAYMEQHHVSLELAARQQRYAWWHQLLNTQYPDALLCLAHHRDDSIETLLFNLMRGTGIKGLTGIPARNQRIVRPMLHVTRSQILDYLAQQQLPYVTDSTNLENDATRNQIRNQLLPLMEQILPQARQGIALTMQHLQQTQQLANQQLDQLFSATQRRQYENIVWHELQADRVLQQHPQCTLTVPELFFYWQERYPGARRHDTLFYTEPSADALAAQTCSLQQTLHTAPFPPFSKQYELFDADTLALPLQCRHWQEGDRMQPLGMTGSKLVSDLFTNAHYTPVQKAVTWVVADARGRIIWVDGLRTAHPNRVTDQTRRVLQLSFKY